MKNILRARVLVPVTLITLVGAWFIYERVCFERDRYMLNVMIKDTTLPLDILIMRQTGIASNPHVNDRRVIRDEAFFSTQAPASEVAAALKKFAAKHGKWDERWINWAVYDNRANNGTNRPNAPDDFRTLIWIAVDTNADLF